MVRQIIAGLGRPQATSTINQHTHNSVGTKAAWAIAVMLVAFGWWIDEKVDSYALASAISTGEVKGENKAIAQAVDQLRHQVAGAVNRLETEESYTVQMQGRLTKLEAKK